jgi:hypothetical protein
MTERNLYGRKLTPREFSSKYLFDGEMDYAFQRLGIGDGCDEFDQVMINNMMALRQQITDVFLYSRSVQRQMDKHKGSAEKVFLRLAAFSAAGIAAGAAPFVFSLIRALKGKGHETIH